MQRNFVPAGLAPIAILGLSLAACTAYGQQAEVRAQGPTPAVESTPTAAAADQGAELGQVSAESGIEGYLWIGPACPVVDTKTECPDLPYEAEFTITDPAGNVVAEGRSDSNGYFRLLLPPGGYIFEPSPAKPLATARANPVPFVVSPGSFTEIEVTYDSGLR